MKKDVAFLTRFQRC